MAFAIFISVRKGVKWQRSCLGVKHAAFARLKRLSGELPKQLKRLLWQVVVCASAGLLIANFLVRRDET